MPVTITTLASNSNRTLAFPLVNGKVNISTGVITAVTLINCANDGSITLNTYGVTMAMLAGDVYSCDPQSITVVSGRFNLA